MPLTDRARAILLNHLFLGRRDVHARRRPGEAWDVVPGPPRWLDLELHARGEVVLGLYAPSTSPNWVVLEVPDQEAARAVERAARQRRLPLVAGAGGLCFWLPFAGPVAARTATDLVSLLQSAAGLRLQAPDPNRPQPLPPGDGSPQAWEELAAVEPLEPWRATRILAERLDREFGPLPLWAPPAGPATEPAELEVALGAHLELRGPLPPGLEAMLEHTRMSRTPRGWARCWGWRPDGMVCAPEVWPDLRHYLDFLGHPYRLEDRRLEGPVRPVPRRPVLRQEETNLLTSVLEPDRCRLQSETTELPRLLARACLAARALPALVVTGDLEAWGSELSQDLGIPAAEIGVLDGEQAWLGNLVTVGSWKALVNRDLSQLARYVAHLVLDPGPDLSGPAAIDIVRQFAARHVLTVEPPDWSPAPAMLRAWLGDRLRVGPREFRVRGPRPSGETPAVAPRSPRGPRRRHDSSDQMLLSFE